MAEKQFTVTVIPLSSRVPRLSLSDLHSHLYFQIISSFPDLTAIGRNTQDISQPGLIDFTSPKTTKKWLMDRNLFGKLTHVAEVGKSAA